MYSAGCFEDGDFQCFRRYRLDCHKESPLICIRTEFLIDKYAGATVARLFLQGKGDEVTESTLWQSVLAWKEPVIGGKLELPAVCTRVTDDRGPKPASLARGYCFGEENPCMGAVTRAGDRQGDRDVEFSA